MTESPTTDRFVPTIIDKVDCQKHFRDVGDPCYVIHAATSNSIHMGVCNRRALKAGMVGKVSPGSLSTNKPKKEWRAKR